MTDKDKIFSKMAEWNHKRDIEQFQREYERYLFLYSPLEYKELMMKKRLYEEEKEMKRLGILDIPFY